MKPGIAFLVLLALIDCAGIVICVAEAAGNVGNVKTIYKALAELLVGMLCILTVALLT